MISFFERVTHSVKGIKGFFVLDTKGTILNVFSELPLIEGDILHSMAVFVHSIRAFKEFDVLTVEGKKGKLIVYQMGDMELGFYCDSTINPLLLDIAVKKRFGTLEEQIQVEMHRESKKLKDSLKEVAHQYMGSAGEALIEKEFSPGVDALKIPELTERAASLLIGPTRASAMRNELEAVIGGIDYD